MSDTGKQFDINELVETRSAAEVEAQMVADAEAQAIAAAENMSPADRASMFFQSLYPQYEHHLNGLNRKELIRLAAALVHFPLEDVMPKTEAGNNSLAIGLRLIDAKLVMRETIAMEEREELDNREKEEYNKTKAEADAIVAATVTTFEQGEKANE